MSVLVPAFHTVVGHLREIPQRIEPRCEPLLLSDSCVSVLVPAFHTVGGHLREIPQRIEPRCEPLLLSVSYSPLPSHFGISEVELWKHFINETTWQMDWTILRRQA